MQILVNDDANCLGLCVRGGDLRVMWLKGQISGREIPKPVPAKAYGVFQEACGPCMKNTVSSLFKRAKSQHLGTGVDGVVEMLI